MKALLGRKIGMTQVFGENDELVGVTAIEAGPCVVVQVKTEKKDGYKAIQLGFEEVPERKATKPAQGHFAKAKVKPRRHLAEVLVEDLGEYKVGQTIGVDVFAEGDVADVTGTSKGKGFAGVVKRWGFRGGPASHGAHFHRAPGSIGAAATPSRVFKGRKLPGQMGNVRVTATNLKVVRVDPERNLLLLRGSVPGARGSLVMVRSAKKARAKKGSQ